MNVKGKIVSLCMDRLNCFYKKRKLCNEFIFRFFFFENVRI